ncbi:MAG: hypothetical protein ABWK05_01275 [Pyrobaculum sp.]
MFLGVITRLVESVGCNPYVTAAYVSMKGAKRLPPPLYIRPDEKTATLQLMICNEITLWSFSEEDVIIMTKT